MKKIFVLTMLFAFATTSFSQQVAPKQHWTETDDYKKSKKQKTAAWIFTAAGSAVLLTTLLVEAFSVAVTLGQDKASGTALPYAVGAACVATGVVFFVASGKNKRKAKTASVFINMERTHALQQAMIRNHSFPALWLKISL